MMERVSDELLQAKKALQTKYRQIANFQNDQAAILQTTFEPITTPLKQLVDKTSTDWKDEEFVPKKPRRKMKGFKIPRRVKEITRENWKRKFVKSEPRSIPNFISDGDYLTYDPEENVRATTSNAYDQEEETDFGPAQTSTPQRIDDLSRDPFRESALMNQTTVQAAETPGESTQVPTAQMGEKNLAALETSQVRDQARTPTGRKELNEFLKRFPPHARKYISYLTLGKSESSLDVSKLDKNYGPRVMGTSGVFLGSLPLKFEHDDIILGGNTRARGTEGMYNLLFLQNPQKYTPDDLMAYQDFIMKSNVARHGYSSVREVNRFGGIKYSKFIRPIYPSKTGRGIIPPVQLATKNTLPESAIRDLTNPNLLTNGLRLYISSYEAGNLHLRTIIDSIISRLKELGYIAEI